MQSTAIRDWNCCWQQSWPDYLLCYNCRCLKTSGSHRYGLFLIGFIDRIALDHSSKKMETIRWKSAFRNNLRLCHRGYIVYRKRIRRTLYWEAHHLHSWRKVADGGMVLSGYRRRTIGHANKTTMEPTSEANVEVIAYSIRLQLVKVMLSGTEKITLVVRRVIRCKMLVT